jgi:hypothetical protein
MNKSLFIKKISSVPVAPELRLARIASRPNCVSPELRLARIAPREYASFSLHFVSLKRTNLKILVQLLDAGERSFPQKRREI